MTQTITLETHIINPKKASIGSVIWMHGLGADNHDFDTLIPDLCNGDQLPLRFIFPNAPIRPVSINHEMPTRAWYDVYSLTDLNREDKAGINASQQTVAQLIQQEIENGVSPKKILLAGFSQGGAMALYAGMRHTQSVAGILALSCYLPLLHKHLDNTHPSNIDTPIFMAHGIYDMTLPYFAGKMAYDVVRRSHSNAQWKEYPMGHEIAPEEIVDIREFLFQIFDASRTTFV